MRFTFLLLLLFPLLVHTQTESWTGVSLDKEVSSRWAYAVDIEHRRSLSAAPEEIYLFLLAGNVQAFQNASLTFGSRFEPAAHGDPGTLRVFTDLNYKYPLGNGPFTLESRFRYQQDRPPGENGNLRRVAFRPRLGVSTQINDRFTLIAEFEGRFRFDRRNEWSRARYTAGLEYSATDRLKLELFWRQEDRVNSAPRSDTIFGLYADYKLPNKLGSEARKRQPLGRKLTW
jgi:hypothetical protein